LWKGSPLNPREGLFSFCDTNLTDLFLQANHIIFQSVTFRYLPGCVVGAESDSFAIPEKQRELYGTGARVTPFVFGKQDT
jgi:hypothetical protein